MTPKLQTIHVIGDMDMPPGRSFRLTDPCYSRNPDNTYRTDLCAIVDNLLHGTWVFTVRTVHLSPRETRVSSVQAFHRFGSPARGESTELTSLCVDSGQFGIFDDAKFPQGDPGEYGDETTFYGRACADRKFGALMPEGLVCDAGFGDGEYKGYYLSEGGKVTFIQVEFISQQEIDEE